MKIRWLHLLLPLLGAVLSFWMVSTAFWDNIKMALLTALSVMAAGVLVRLARGLPFTNADQFQLDEARAIASAIVQSARSLRALMVVVFLTMGAVIFAAPLARNAIGILEGWSAAAGLVEPILSAVVGFLFTYVLVRIFAVIGSDVGLVNLQTKYLVKAVERKQAKSFDDAQAASDEPPMKNPEGYGKVIQ